MIAYSIERNKKNGGVGGDPADYQVTRHMAFQTGQPGNLMVSARLNARGTRQKGPAIGQNQSLLEYPY